MTDGDKASRARAGASGRAGQIADGLVMIEEASSEHLEFFDIPAGHDIETEPPAADVIRGRAPLPASNASYYVAPDWETRQR